MPTLKQTFTAGIQNYTGRSVADVEIHADPKVAGAYAIRASMKDGKTIDFLVCAGWDAQGRSPVVVSAFLEEAEFTSWPPTSGNVKFFV